MSLKNGTHRPKSIISQPLVGLLFFFALMGCDQQDASQPESNASVSQPSGVLVESAEMISAGQDYEVVADGFLRATNQIKVVSEVSGLVVGQSDRLFAGGIIDQGELLVQVEKNIYAAEHSRAQAQVDSAKAAMRNAELNLQRQQELAKKQVVSDAALDQADTDLVAAQAAKKQALASLVLADERLSDTAIKTPFKAGVISENVSVGAFVTVGQELAEIYDLSEVEMLVGVAQSQAKDVINAFQNGFNEATIMRQDGQVLFEGEIKAVVPQLDQISRTVNFRITAPNVYTRESNTPSVLLGEFLKVALTASSDKEIYSAPQSALREERFVYAIQADNTLKRLAVQPLSRTEDEVFFQVEDTETLSQLKAQSDPVRLLKTDLPESYEGLKVRIAEAQGENQ